MVQLRSLDTYDWWPCSPPSNAPLRRREAAPLPLQFVGPNPMTLSSDSISLVHRPSLHPRPRTVNDLQPVKTDGTVHGKQNSLPRRCQNPVWMIQQWGTILLIRHPGRVDLPGNSVYSVGESGRVESGVSASRKQFKLGYAQQQSS